MSWCPFGGSRVVPPLTGPGLGRVPTGRLAGSFLRRGRAVSESSVACGSAPSGGGKKPEGGTGRTARPRLWRFPGSPRGQHRGASATASEDLRALDPGLLDRSSQPM